MLLGYEYNIYKLKGNIKIAAILNNNRPFALEPDNLYYRITAIASAHYRELFKLDYNVRQNC